MRTRSLAARLSLASVLAISILPVAAGCGGAWTYHDGPGRFITSMCASGDTLWIGTEDTGLWRVNLAAGPERAEAWWQFEVGYDPPPTTVYGIAVDAFGRVWFGSACQGVTVYNGRNWKTYGLLEGCAGWRVFDIAADPDPARADVWIATDGGLTRFSPGAGVEDLWRTYTRRDGMPSDQITAVAIGPKNRIWVGTEADGLAWADPPYARWMPWQGSAETGKQGSRAGRPNPPSPLINAIAVRGDGAVAVSTPAGVGFLASPRATAWTWVFGESGKPGECYTRGLAWDKAGNLWVATRHKGLVRLNCATGEVQTFQRLSAPKGKPGEAAPPPPPPTIPDNYATAVAVTPDGSVWCGTYGKGLARMATAPPPCGLIPRPAAVAPAVVVPAAVAPAAVQPAAGKAAATGAPVAVTPAAGKAPAKPGQKAVPPLPQPMKPPTPGELASMLQDVRKAAAAPPEQQPAILRFNDDWLTRGDWLGRHGRYWACLCAICSPSDYLWGAGPEPVKYRARIGAEYSGKDSLRYWVHWLYTDNPNSLEMPPTYFHSRVLKGYQTWEMPRRQAEWCDSGHSYPTSAEGPDIYCTLQVPKGLFYLSLYFNNKDGHMGNNRFRDFTLSVRQPPAGKAWADIADFDQWPEGARGRTVDFWHGTYKRFLVRGPGEFVFRVGRNHSFNTCQMGAFLDLVDELPVPYFDDAARSARQLGSGQAGAEASLLEELQRVRKANTAWWVLQSRPMYAALARALRGRTAESVAKTPAEKALYARLATCYYELGLYASWEAALSRAGLTPAREIEKAIRWDGVRDFDGKGFEAVTEHLKQHPVATPGAAGR
jgi:hypothetical protein